jgi:hypothetical protein
MCHNGSVAHPGRQISELGKKVLSGFLHEAPFVGHRRRSFKLRQTFVW